MSYAKVEMDAYELSGPPPDPAEPGSCGVIFSSWELTYMLMQILPRSSFSVLSWCE